MNKKFQKGFSLIQVIITSVIASVLALAFSRLIATQMASTSYLEDKLEKIQIVRNIENLLKDDLSCQNSLKSSKIDFKNKKIKVNFQHFKDSKNNNIYSSNKASDRLFIGQMTFTNISLNTPNSYGYIKLQVPISRVRKTGGPTEFKPYETTVQVFADSTGLIKDCFTTKAPISCQWRDIKTGVLELGCLSGEYIEKLKLEKATWTDNLDNHIEPEVYSAYCCKIP